MADQILEFPKRPLHQLHFVMGDSPYVKSLRDRAQRLAPILWRMTDPEPRYTWEQALQDPRYEEHRAKCLATAEMVIRLVDVINTPLGYDPDV